MRSLLFVVVNIGSVVWCFSIRRSGRGLYLQLTDGVSFFLLLFIFFISVGVGFLRWIKLRLVPCFFCYKNYT